MARDREKLTKRIVDALQPDPKGRDVIHFDSEIRGFGVRVRAQGAKSTSSCTANKFKQLPASSTLLPVGPGMTPRTGPQGQR